MPRRKERSGKLIGIIEGDKSDEYETASSELFRSGLESAFEVKRGKVPTDKDCSEITTALKILDDLSQSETKDEIKKILTNGFNICKRTELSY